MNCSLWNSGLEKCLFWSQKKRKKKKKNQSIFSEMKFSGLNYPAYTIACSATGNYLETTEGWGQRPEAFIWAG